VVFADNHPEYNTGTVLHAGFNIGASNGAVVLSQNGRILDYLSYSNMQAGQSFGSYPDGQLFDRQIFYYASPGTSNNPAPVPVAINEWMASNTRTLVDPATGRYDDWFELYNFGTGPVDLSGYYLTDDPATPKKWKVPNGVLLPAHGYLLVWADNDATPGGTNYAGGALHSSFQLAKSGDRVAMYSPGGVPVDILTFGAQTSDVSQGRFPDGNVAGPVVSMNTPTPGTTNIGQGNLHAPVLAAVPNQFIHLGATLHLTLTASDADSPAQHLTYSLNAAPFEASLDPNSGAFTWNSTGASPGTNTVIVSVSDDGTPILSDQKTFSIIVVPKPTVSASNVAAGAFQLNWTAISGVTYRVQWRSDLVTGSWQDLAGDITSTGESASTSISIDNAGQKFFRIIEVQ
jgi:hypothetical protein